MYTSGSTGTPKGVLIRHENIVAAMAGQKERVFPMVDVDNDIYIAYLPLAHILELSCEMLVFFLGIKCGYSSPQTLTDQSTAIKRGDKGDLQVLRPHLMCCVPVSNTRQTSSVSFTTDSLVRRQFSIEFTKVSMRRFNNRPLFNVISSPCLTRSKSNAWNSVSPVPISISNLSSLFSLHLFISPSDGSFLVSINWFSVGE